MATTFVLHSKKFKSSLRSNCKEGSAFRKLLCHYKAAARHRNLPWELTDEQFRLLTSSPCFYTGSKPSTVSKADSGEIYLYNGIDRLDSKLGYTWENCVPCCGEVNLLKRGLPYDRFVGLCTAVSDYLKLKRGE